jgi:hypothetical protein
MRGWRRQVYAVCASLTAFPRMTEGEHPYVDARVEPRVKPAHDGDSCLCTLGMTRVLP